MLNYAWAKGTLIEVEDVEQGEIIYYSNPEQPEVPWWLHGVGHGGGIFISKSQTNIWMMWS